MKKKAIIVFTNNNSLVQIGIEQVIPSFPVKIIVNENLSLFLFSDRDEKPDLQFIKEQFDEVYLIFHKDGSTDNDSVKNLFKNKLKNYKTISHIKGSGNFYDRQLRTILESVVVNEDVRSPWTIQKSQPVEEEFLLEPFMNNGLEIKLKLLTKLLAGDFVLDGAENLSLKENTFDLKAFKKSYNLKEINWKSFKVLRDKLLVNM